MMKHMEPGRILLRQPTETIILKNELQRSRERESRQEVEIQRLKFENIHKSKLSKTKIKFLNQRIKSLEDDKKKTNAILLTLPEMQKRIELLTEENVKLKQENRLKKQDQERRWVGFDSPQSPAPLLDDRIIF